MNYLILCVLFIFTQFVGAQQQDIKSGESHIGDKHHLKHKTGQNEHYVGSHGMTLLLIDGHALAYHLPLYTKPHDYQLLYKVELGNELKQKLSGKGLVTLLPEIFDLQQLILGNSISLKAKVFYGHFERGGEFVDEVDIHFQAPLYKHKIEQEYTNEVFDSVELSKEKRLYIHRINGRPSFDLLLVGQTNTSKKVSSCQRYNLETGKDLKTIESMESCLKGKTVYFEYLDFQ